MKTVVMMALVVLACYVTATFGQETETVAPEPEMTDVPQDVGRGQGRGNLLRFLRFREAQLRRVRQRNATLRRVIAFLLRIINNNDINRGTTTTIAPTTTPDAAVQSTATMDQSTATMDQSTATMDQSSVTTEAQPIMSNDEVEELRNLMEMLN